MPCIEKSADFQFYKVFQVQNEMTAFQVETRKEGGGG